MRGFCAGGVGYSDRQLGQQLDHVQLGLFVFYVSEVSMLVISILGDIQDPLVTTLEWVFLVRHALYRAHGIKNPLPKKRV